MITASGWDAVFKDDEGYHHKNVVAWNDQGIAMVVDEVNGRLRRADSYSSSFHHLSEAIDLAARHVVPGQGWVVCAVEDDGSESVYPVVAFSVEVDGGIGSPFILVENEYVVSVQQQVADNEFYEDWRLVPPANSKSTSG